MGIFEVLNEKCKLQHKAKILFLQYCKIIRQQSRNSKERTGHLRMKANTYEYKGKDIIFKEPFSNGINKDEMITEIIWELITVNKTN